MRVLHVNTERGWRGGERQTLLTVRGLLERGVWAGLVAQPGCPLYSAAAERGVIVHPLRIRGGFDPLAALRLARIVRDSGAGLLHLQTAHAGNLALLARLFGARPLLVASRRVDFRVKSAWKYNRFDAVAAVSEAIRRILIEGGVEGERIRVIRDGIPVDVRRPPSVDALRRELAEEGEGDEEGGPLVGAVGHLTAHKGHRHLLEALPAILEQRPRLKLALIGDGELRGALERQARELGVAGRVVFAGFRADALDLLWALDLLVLPSVEEGLCTTLLDAMLRGVPIVASAAGGIPEALDDGRFGRLVPPGHPQALAEAVVAVLADEAGRRAMTEGAGEWVRRRFGADAMVDATLNLYRELSG